MKPFYSTSWTTNRSDDVTEFFILPFKKKLFEKLDWTIFLFCLYNIILKKCLSIHHLFVICFNNWRYWYDVLPIRFTFIILTLAYEMWVFFNYLKLQFLKLLLLIVGCQFLNISREKKPSLQAFNSALLWDMLLRALIYGETVI